MALYQLENSNFNKPYRVSVGNITLKPVDKDDIPDRRFYITVDGVHYMAEPSGNTVSLPTPKPAIFTVFWAYNPILAFRMKIIDRLTRN